MSINPLRLDPTHLTGVYRRWVADLRSRWADLREGVWELLVTEDAFGLVKDPAFTILAEPQRWRFLNDTSKHVQFQRWFDQRVKEGVLAVQGVDMAPWTGQYILNAYKAGVTRAYTAARPDVGAAGPDFLLGARTQFLESAFNSPAAIDKVLLLFERDYAELKGIAAHMTQEMSRVVADGLAAGIGPRELAKRLNKVLDGHLTRAKTLARTDLTRAHAEGQLDAFEAIDPEMELEVLAEWVTGAKPCPQCQPMAGVVLTIAEARGMIPRHPNCQCAWVPARVGRGRRGNPTTRARLERAILRSVRAERPKRADAKWASKWVGAT